MNEFDKLMKRVKHAKLIRQYLFIVTVIVFVMLAGLLIKEIHDYAHHSEWCQNEKGNWTRRDCNGNS